ncbi:MAG: glycosyltransferase [Brevundimonas sp.]
MAVTKTNHIFEPVGSVDSSSKVYVSGWAYDKSRPMARQTVYMEHEGRIVSTAVARQHRPDVAAAGFGDGRYGFQLPVPLAMRAIGADSVTVGLMDDAGGRHPLGEMFVPRDTLKAAIVTDTAYTKDASRYYRGELQQKQLWHSGCEVAVVSRDDVDPDSLKSFDFIILQRTRISDVVRAIIRNAISLSQPIFYETDDLNTFKELRAHFGSVLSGHYWKDQPELLSEIDGRFIVSNSVDSVIVPNRYMQRWYNSRGYNTVLSPFKIEDRFLSRRRVRKAGKEWRLLYMSGSPTHVHDFASVRDDVLRFVSDNIDVELTVFGHFDPKQFAGVDRVNFRGPVPYEAMFEVYDDADLLIAPFAKSPFNLAKSPTKFMEAGARGVPVMVSSIPAYRPHIRQSGCGYVVPWRKSWYEALQDAYGNREVDLKHNRELIRYVQETFALSNASNGLLLGLENAAIGRAPA